MQNQVSVGWKYAAIGLGIGIVLQFGYWVYVYPQSIGLPANAGR